MRVESTIKSAKLQLLKGLWITKFGFDQSVNELMEAYFMFADAQGDERNYFGANCQLEIASNYMRQKDISGASTSLHQAVDTYEHLFGEDHPLMQKYYNYSSDLFSYSNDNVSMISMANKNLDIVEKFNQTNDGSLSLFVLDAQLQLVSMLCQANENGSKKQEILDTIAKMEQACGENGVIDGCQLLHSAYTMKSMSLIREEKIQDALQILEETFES